MTTSGQMTTLDEQPATELDAMIARYDQLREQRTHLHRELLKALENECNRLEQEIHRMHEHGQRVAREPVYLNTALPEPRVGGNVGPAVDWLATTAQCP